MCDTVSENFIERGTKRDEQKERQRDRAEMGVKEKELE